MNQKNSASQTELQILFVLKSSEGEGVYGLNIKKAIDFCGGESQELAMGSLYSCLKRLRRKGLIESSDGESIGREAARKYYKLTQKGEEEVNQINRFHQRLLLWNPYFSDNIVLDGNSSQENAEQFLEYIEPMMISQLREWLGEMSERVR